MQKALDHLKFNADQLKELGADQLSRDLLKVVCLLTNSVDLSRTLGEICMDEVAQLEAYYVCTPRDMRSETKRRLECEAEQLGAQTIEQITELLNMDVTPLTRLAVLRTMKHTLNTLTQLAAKDERKA